MNKLKLSIPNFILLQKTIYQLEDKSVCAHAESILNDIERWINDHFDLKANERQDLMAMDWERKKDFALNMSFAITNRFLITWRKRLNISPSLRRGEECLLSELDVHWGKLFAR